MACCPRRREVFFAFRVFFVLLVWVADASFDFDLGGVVA
jgi:hypothetical protein